MWLLTVQSQSTCSYFFLSIIVANLVTRCLIYERLDDFSSVDVRSMHITRSAIECFNSQRTFPHHQFPPALYRTYFQSMKNSKSRWQPSAWHTRSALFHPIIQDIRCTHAHTYTHSAHTDYIQWQMQNHGKAFYTRLAGGSTWVQYKLKVHRSTGVV